ncbi:hypothetical protein [Parasitella parasitica]|uniref:Uncharacterized protein n=1 Tax=Parasitella parasitica TaxID=35722 RepID=A0A0B7N1C5_9FUNG|nr:hypothetical protein [Parasitella parasitica]
MDRNENDSKWEFDMPQFWDFTDSIPQTRPDERWFCQANISGPSFPERKKRRALRVHKKPVAEPQTTAEKLPMPEKPRSNVFDRLSRLGTISFANKTQHSTTEKEKRPLKQHVSQPKLQQHTANVLTQEHEQYHLDEEMPKESVAERISRIEKDIFSKRDIPLKRKISSSAPLQQKKIQKIINTQHDTEHSYIPPRQPSPARESSSTTPKLHSRYSSSEERPIQPAKEQPSSSSSKRISLLNELQNSRWPSPIQSNQELESSSMEEEEEKLVSQIQIDQTLSISTAHRSLYNELKDSQQQSATIQSIETQLSPPHLQPQSPPVSSTEDAQANKENENTSSRDFFDSLLMSKQQRENTQKESTSNFFKNLLTSNKQHCQNRSPPPRHSSVNENQDEQEAAQEEEEKEATANNFFDDLLIFSKQRNGIRVPLSPIKDKHATRNSVSNPLETDKHGGRENRHPMSPFIPDEAQNQQHVERQDVPSSSHPTQVDSSQANPTQTHRESLLVNRPSLLSRPIQVYRDEPIQTHTRKSYYSLDDSQHFVDETVQRARELLKASRERTQKWMRELSVNQPLKASQNIKSLKK